MKRQFHESILSVPASGHVAKQPVINKVGMPLRGHPKLSALLADEQARRAAHSFKTDGDGLGEASLPFVRPVASQPALRRGTNARTAAFTLIELLVVIVIVGVLAGLVLAVLGPVQQNGKASQCVSNMRQIFSALTLYTQDHANTLPLRKYNAVDSQGVTIGYPELILGYLDPGTPAKFSATAKKIFNCPSQSKPSYPDEPGYGMNWYYDNVNLGVISQPTQTICLADTLGQLGKGTRRADRDNTSDDIGKLDPKRHLGKANYLFFDGHISRLTYDETRKKLTSSQEVPPPDMWGTDHGVDQNGQDNGNHSQPAPTPPYEAGG